MTITTPRSVWQALLTLLHQWVSQRLKWLHMASLAAISICTHESIPAALSDDSIQRTLLNRQELHLFLPVPHGMRWTLYQRLVVVESQPMLIRHHSLCKCSPGWRFEYCCTALMLNQESGPAGLWYVWSRIFWALDLLPHLKWPLKLDFLVRNSNF